MTRKFLHCPSQFPGVLCSVQSLTKARFQSSSHDVLHDFYFGVSNVIIKQHQEVFRWEMGPQSPTLSITRQLSGRWWFQWSEIGLWWLGFYKAQLALFYKSECLRGHCQLPYLGMQMCFCLGYAMMTLVSQQEDSLSQGLRKNYAVISE